MVDTDLAKFTGELLVPLSELWAVSSFPSTEDFFLIVEGVSSVDFFLDCSPAGGGPTLVGIFMPAFANMASSSGQDLVFSARVRFSISSGRRSSGDMESLEGPDGPKEEGEEPRLLGDWLLMLLTDRLSAEVSWLSQREMLCRKCVLVSLCAFLQ